MTKPLQDADNSGRVSYKEWTNGMYRLRLDTWPVISDMEQGAAWALTTQRRQNVPPPINETPASRRAVSCLVQVCAGC
eukprot:s2043_g1.t1